MHFIKQRIDYSSIFSHYLIMLVAYLKCSIGTAVASVQIQFTTLFFYDLIVTTFHLTSPAATKVANTKTTKVNHRGPC